MADTVEIFIGGLSLVEARQRIEQCTGLPSETDQYGVIDFAQPDFIASLSVHSYADGGDVDVTAHELELSAKNYWDPEAGGEEASPTVQWFRTLFSCLSSHNDSRLLLTYNFEDVLDRFDPVT